MSAFSKHLGTIRKTSNLTQTQLAKLIGVTQQCVSSWENDAIEPTLGYLWRLADVFNISIDELVGRDRFGN